MSSSNCCFLTCMKISQEADQVIFNFKFLKSLWEFSTVYCDPHSQRLWHVNKAEIDVCFFFNSLAFSMIQWMLVICSLVPLPFLNPAWTSGSLLFMYSWSLAWRILSNYFASVWDECNCVVVWTLFGTWDGMKTDLFQSCGHCCIFQICWHVECSTFTTSSFRIWNNSIGIPSPPLALFIVMLPKVHLTSYSRVSGSMWVITSSWLSGW